MPTPTSVIPVLPRSVGPLPLSPRTTAAYDPAQGAWIDPERPDDLDPAAADPLAPMADAMAERGVHLRPWRAADAADFCALLDNPAVRAHLPDAASVAIAGAAGMIALANRLESHIVRAATCDDMVLGQVRLDRAPGAGMAEISYWLGRAHWGQGYGTALVAGTVARAFARMPDLLRLVAKVHPANPASARLLAKAGFRPCTAPPGMGFADWRWFSLRRQHQRRGISSDASP